MMNYVKSFEPGENRLEGDWVTIDGKVVADETARRIEALISEELTRITASPDGWDILFLDQRDGRKWELTYPHKEWHGGGPPTLTCISDTYAQSKYNIGATP